MDKIKCIWRDFIHPFLSRRLLVFCVFQFSILHYYADSVRQFAAAADYPAAPWLLPFVGQNAYYQFVYGISIVYFYSDVPFLQRYEMYALIRQGRARWVSIKLLRIWISALLLAATAFFLGILALLPRLEWTTGWGRLYHTLAVGDTAASYNGRLFFSYELISGNNAMLTTLILLAVMCMITGLTGTVLYMLSLAMNRTVAILAGTAFAVLSVVVKNLEQRTWFRFLSPFSWLDLLFLYGKAPWPAPSFSALCAAAVILEAVLAVFSYRITGTKDFNWIEEE